MSCPLYPRERTRLRIEMNVGGHQSWSDDFENGKVQGFDPRFAQLLASTYNRRVGKFKCMKRELLSIVLRHAVIKCGAKIESRSNTNRGIEVLFLAEAIFCPAKRPDPLSGYRDIFTGGKAAEP